MTVLVADILARAGGGQNFGGGGGGGGGSFGSGGGGVPFLPFLFFGGGSIGFLVLLFVGVLVLRAIFSAARTSTEKQPPSFDPGAGQVPAVPAATGPYDDTHPVGVPERFRGATLPGSSAEALGADVDQGLAAIRGHDPDFDDTAFLGEVERAFFVVEQAWSERKPELSRSVMADSLWQQHKVQIDEYTAQGRHNALDGLSVGRASIIGAHHDQRYDTITVRILAASADYDVDDKSGRVVSGHRDIQQWTEDWTFQRAGDATTKVGGGTLARKCPNCGAPLDVDLAGVCSYCHAPIMGGAYDWVLSRIDQVIPAYS